eukprot:TRINITY_DN3167_c0_g1_i1.p1 TRINITY_DN3167_c0_g1~~TRINITY_DN3167_c0_g1_i1.p1  ORF type:complete len:1748 (+),score=500.61 TRINITY_DN3167_c0_g1_i1:141-5384(+)
MADKPIKKKKDQAENQAATEIVNTFGFEACKTENLHYISEHTLLTASGNTVQFVDTNTGEVTFFLGSACGIGAICVHPAKTHFVVGEKGKLPNVYIYSYPSKQVQHVLRQGTEREFSSMAFNHSGDKLATVGAEPDFMLTVWNWADERIILRSKAFGARIFRVTFSKGDDGQLTTCGAGHIKFWKMAQTFTGLKLQGSIGKFGKVEISDISGYVELPDGKVVSGSEWGALLMWENNLIKTEIRKPELIPCHNGAVEVVVLEQGNECLITAGHDGYIRWWPFDKIDQADTFDHAPIYTTEPIYEMKVADDCIIKGMTRGPKNWMVQDGSGAFWIVPDIPWQEIKAGRPPINQPVGKLFKHFHAGPVTCLEVCPMDHFAITGGSDGTVRLFDYVAGREIFHSRFSAGTSCLYYFPLHLDPEGRTFVVGFANGVVRVLRRCADAFSLVAVMKPHTGEISSLTYSSDGAILVTCSKDQTIFFFEVTDPLGKYQPIGFSKLPSTPRFLSWDKTENQATMCMEDGTILLVETPTLAEVDHSVTYEFVARYRKLVYNQKLKPKEEPKAIVDERREEEEARPAGAEEEGAEEEEEEEQTGPWAVNFVLPSPDGGNAGKLLIGLQRKDSILAYMGNSWSSPHYDVFAEDPLNTISLPDTVAVSCRYSRSGKYLIAACEEGKVFLRPTKDLNRSFTSALVHDGMYGTVLQATTSYDDQYLLSVGADGCFFMQRILGQERAEPTHKLAPLLQSSKSERVVPDIANRNAYSIQEAKLKADEDKRREIAEQKKKSLREQVQELLAEYETILRENEAAERGKRVAKDELELDPAIKVILTHANEERVENALKELAWDTAKKELRLEKLRAAFINTLQVERIMLYGFRSGRNVSSFRTPQLTERQRRNIASVHELINSEETKRRQAAQLQSIGEASGDDLSSSLRFGQPQKFVATEAERRVAADQSGAESSGAELSGTEGALNTTMKRKKKDKQQPLKSALDKAEDRKRERDERVKGLQALKARMPNENTEDHKDMALIARAEKFMGDYKLKTDEDYVVPENQRVTAERKLRQLILLEESVNTLRMDFNDRFLALRDLKRRLVENINRDNKRIAEINKQLGREEELYAPAMQPDEQPENRQTADRETLRKFEKEQMKARKRQLAIERQKAQFGGDLVAAHPQEGENSSDSSDDGGEAEDGKPKKKKGEQSAEDQGKKGKGQPAELEPVVKGKRAGGRLGGRRESLHLTAKQKMELERKERIAKIAKSELEKEELSLNTEKLLFEKSRLQRKIEKTIATFDDALDELRREKFKLEGDLKMADMKLLLLYRELMLLKDFKKRDQQLSKKLEDRRSEKADIMGKIQQCQEKLSDKKVEIERLLAREKQIMQEFNACIATSQQAQDALVKIFKKKIRRRKRVDAESVMSGSTTSDVSDMSDDDEDYDDDEEEEQCPPGCDPATFKRVVELRERRLEQEDIVNDFQKSIEALRKENEQLSKKEKTIDTQLKQVEKEIQQFQNEKQKELNELETVVVLKLKQHQCLAGPEGNQMPRNNKELVVFTNQGMKALHTRILDLGQEKKTLNRYFQDLKRQHVSLNKARKEKQQNVGNWEGKVYEIQLLKFGQKIDLERLENVSVDRKTEELKEELKIEEAKLEAELKKWDVKLEETKSRQAGITDENSQMLRTLGTLRQDQQKLEDILNMSQNKILQRMTGGSKVASATDRKKLKELVIAQQQEIDRLKSEMAMLRRKGGHVYTPVVNKVVN